MMKLTIIGNGYTAQFLAKDALRYGYEVSIITRNISNPETNIHYLNFYDYNIFLHLEQSCLPDQV